MSWAEIKKAVNSDLSTPLNSKIDAQTTTLANKFGWHIEEKGTITYTTKTFNKDGLLMINSPSSSSGNHAQVQEGSSNNSNNPVIGTINTNVSLYNCIMVVKKNTTYYFNGSNLNYTFFVLGGGI